MEDDTSTESSGRSRRVRGDKYGRLAALEKLKSLKGSKNKYEIVEEAPVYEEVSEKEYSSLIQKRLEDDWIIDDNGSGYVEDGREIFDDDIEEDIYTDKKNKQPKKSLCGPQKKVAKSNDIKSMFKPLPTKRKIEAVVKLDDDDILGNIMNDLHKEADLDVTPKPMVLNKKHKMNHYSPIQRNQINPFMKSKTPLETENVLYNFNASYSPSMITKKAIKPKVVNFENVEENINELDDIIQEDSLKENEVNIEQYTPEVEMSRDISEVECEKELEDDFEFDPSGDIFKENNSLAVEEKPVPSSLEKVEETPPSVPFFQGSFNQEMKENVVDIQVDSKHLPLVKNKDGEQVLRFFWLDAYEDPYKQPGTVYLFGKVYLEDAKSFASCCVIVKDIPRRVFFLPRETYFDLQMKKHTDKLVTMPNVYSEVNSLLEKMKISEFRSKKSQKNYAFGTSEIPDACEYLEVLYPAKYPPLPSNLSGSTFSHILGVDSTSLELLLLEQKIKGPCWVDVYHPQSSQSRISWCKIEACVTKVKDIVCSNESLPTPPIVLMSLNLITSLNSKTQNEIVAVSCLVHQQFPLDKTAPEPKYQSHFCVLTKPSDVIFPYDFEAAISKYANTKVERTANETSLLTLFLAKLAKIDPDVIVGHDVLGFYLDVLLQRLSTNNIPKWSRIGRLKRAGMPRLNIAQGGIAEKNAMCGRLLCDLKISSKELIRCKSYDLEELSNHLLSEQFSEIPSESVHDQYMTSKQLIHLVDFSMRRTELILKLSCELNILPLALQITNIAGCIMSRTLLGGRSERNEYLLLHAFHAKNFIPPPKVLGKKAQKNQNEDDDLETTGKKRKEKACI